MNDTLDLNALLANDRWLRRLVLRLVAPDVVDDVLQETWLKAIAHAERGDELPPRPWLAAVARNFARRWRRDEAARTAREGRVEPRASAAPSTHDTVARLAEQRRVADAVLGLAEPYRRTVVGHFLDGRSPRELAELDGVPAATVRSRLARGVAQLRERLARDDGRAEDAWRDALVRGVFGVPLAELRRALPVASATAAGSTAVATSSSGIGVLGIAAVGIVAVAVAIGVGWFDGTADEPNATVRTGSAPGAVAEAPVGAVVVPERRVSLDPQPAAAGSAVRPDAVAKPVASAPQPVAGHGTGRVVDVRGEPIEGVELTVRGAEPDAASLAVSDAHGAFDAPADRPIAALVPRAPWQFVRLDGWRAPTVEAPCTLVVAPAVTLRGTVVDADGLALADVAIVYEPPTVGNDPRFAAEDAVTMGAPVVRTAADGSFELGPVPFVRGAGARLDRVGFATHELRFGLGGGDGRQLMTAEGDGGRSVEPITWLPDVATASEAVRVELRALDVEVSTTVHGIVYGPDRTPAAGAEVALGDVRVVTDDDGAFRVVRLDAADRAGPRSVVARSADGSAVGEARLAAGARGERRVDVWLAPLTAALRATLVDAAGQPLAGRVVWLSDPTRIVGDVAERAGSVLAATGDRGLRSAADGSVEIPGLREDRAYALTVLDLETLQAWTSPPLTPGAAERRLVVPVPHDARPGHTLVVRAFGSGEPLAGATVTVAHRATYGPAFVELGKRVLSTDAAGRVDVPTLCSDGSAVHVSAAGYVTRRFDVAGLASIAGRAVELDRAVALRFAPDGTRFANASSLQVLDADGVALGLVGSYRGLVVTGDELPIVELPTPVVETSERGVQLVVRDESGTELRRAPLDFARAVDGVLVVR